MRDRRALLRFAAVAGAVLLTCAHTPYRQWQVYRRKHLIIGTSRADTMSYPLGQRIVALLATHLPESRARVTRGPDPWRLASLITSGQLEVVLLAKADAAALRDGRAPFEAFGATDLRALFAFGDHVLICRPDFPERHAYRVVETLSAQGRVIPGAAPADPIAGQIPIHPGALTYLRGEPAPPEVRDAALAEPLPADHRH